MTATQEALLRYGKDEAGQDILVMMEQEEEEEEGQHQPYRGMQKVVMMEWEKEYMQALVDVLDIQAGKDEVFEIGFGLGYSADAIQQRSPKKHVIIDCDPVVLKRAREWAKNKAGVQIIEGYWQKELKNLGVFDCIFYDDFPLPVKDEDEGAVLEGSGSRWHVFIDLCVSHHMRLGSRITGYCALDLDLSRPDCSFERSTFTVHVPTTCPYSEPGEQTYYIPFVTLRQEPIGCGGSHVITGTKRGDAVACGKGEDNDDGNDTAHTAVKRLGKKRATLLEFVLKDRESKKNNK